MSQTQYFQQYVNSHDPIQHNYVNPLIKSDVRNMKKLIELTVEKNYDLPK